ncbi:hypothetical protein ACQZ6C_10650 [Rhizobium rhizogenes]
MRNSRATQSAVTKRTIIASVASAGADTVIPANGSRMALAIFNKSTAVCSVYLMDLTTYNAGFPMATIDIAAGGYWEDQANYIGDIVLVWASANGQANVTEWE